MVEKKEELLERARRGAANFSLADLEQLYLAWEFSIRPGRHPIARHPLHPKLRNTLPNHKSFAKEYVRSAVKLIDELKQREEVKKNVETSEGEGDGGSKRTS